MGWPTLWRPESTGRDALSSASVMLDASSTFTSVEPTGRPPTILAALGPKMLKLSATATDGAHPYFTPVEHTAMSREILGRGPILAPEVMVVIDPDVSRARDVARSAMARYVVSPNYRENLIRCGFTEDDLDTLSDRLVASIVACGDLQVAVDRVQEHQDAGADHVCIQVLTAGDNLELTVTQWGLLAHAFEL